MTPTLDQINLYNRALLPPQPVFSARAALALWLLSLLVLLAWGTYLHTERSALQRQRVGLANEVQQASQALAPLRAQASERRADPRLGQTVAELERRLAQREQAWQWLAAEAQQSRPAYASWLLALAAAHRDGVWLNQVHLESDWMTLEGRTLDPATLPDWLKHLQHQPALNGLAFSALQMGAEPADAAAEPRPPQAGPAHTRATVNANAAALAGRGFRLQGLSRVSGRSAAPGARP